MDLILSTTAKPKIFLFGACDLYQAVNIDTIRKDFVIDAIPKGLKEIDHIDFSTGIKPKFSTSMLSLYTKPNIVAHRVHESLENKLNLKKYHYELNREILKFSYLKYFSESAGPNDILVMNLSSELYTKIKVKSEIFTAIPILSDSNVNNPDDILYWLYSEYLTKDVYQVPFDDEESVNNTYLLLKDFARDIYEIFQDRVIIVRTHMTDLSLTKLNKVERILVPLENTVPFYKTSKIMHDPADHTYAVRLMNLFVNKFKLWYKEDIPVVALDGPVFVDVNHPLGYAPFHLHTKSNYQLGLNIYKELIKMKNKVSV